ncbi:MAG: glycosyltransferase [Tabrizicola sp.]|jgi:glycosyltransferase involved in cell wall biosynthesis|nr:glycosyltransferase [Tabrizicola sp.]
MTAYSTAEPKPSNVVSLFPAPVPATNRTAIVVPCFNEEKRLDLEAFSEFLYRVPGVRMVFVNDGSHDGTVEVLEVLHSVHPDRVEILSLSRNGGKAEAVRQGLVYAAGSGADFVGYWDADLATPLEAIEDFLRVAQRYGQTEVVYGARLQLLGHRVSRTLSRRIISRICARMARVAVGLPIGDTQCGAKLLRNTPRLRQALAQPFSAGWLFDVELFSRIASSSGSVHAFYEYPLPEWTEVPGSKVSGRAIRRAGLAMLRLIAERRLGVPVRPAATDMPQLKVLHGLTTSVEKAA